MATTSEVMDFLIDRRAVGLSAKDTAEIFDGLVWYLDDNGGELRDIARIWLESDNLERVEAALFMNEGFLRDTRSEMEECFDAIEVRWPHLRPRCIELLSRWDRNQAASW